MELIEVNLIDYTVSYLQKITPREKLSDISPVNTVTYCISKLLPANVTAEPVVVVKTAIKEVVVIDYRIPNYTLNPDGELINNVSSVVVDDYRNPLISLHKQGTFLDNVVATVTHDYRTSDLFRLDCDGNITDTVSKPEWNTSEISALSKPLLSGVVIMD